MPYKPNCCQPVIVENESVETLDSVVLEGSTSGEITLTANPVTTPGTVLILPDSDGTDGQVLTWQLDGTTAWEAGVGAGDALTTNPLSQFAATTSAQLAGVISDETGTGSLVFGSGIYNPETLNYYTAGASGPKVNELNVQTMRFLNENNKLSAYIESRLTRILSGATDNTALWNKEAKTVVYDDWSTRTKYYRQVELRTPAISDIWESYMKVKFLTTN